MSPQKKQCPMCGGEYHKALYMGMPLFICMDDHCSCAEGIGTWFMEHLPVVSDAEYEAGGWALFLYHGNYFKALWRYLTL